MYICICIYKYVEYRGYECMYIYIYILYAYNHLCSNLSYYVYSIYIYLCAAVTWPQSTPVMPGTSWHLWSCVGSWARGELFDFPIDFPSKCWGWCIVPNQQPDLLLYHVVSWIQAKQNSSKRLEKQQRRIISMLSFRRISRNWGAPESRWKFNS